MESGVDSGGRPLQPVRHGHAHEEGRKRQHRRRHDPGHLQSGESHEQRAGHQEGLAPDAASDARLAAALGAVYFSIRKNCTEFAGMR